MKQFRSPTEFAPHAAWLLTDPSLDPSNCECRHCSKSGDCRLKKSRHRSTSAGSTTPAQTESDASPIASPRALRYTPPGLSHVGRSAPSRATQRSLRGISREASICEVFPQREELCVSVPPQLSDLTAHTQGRIYRDQELVWYILETPWQISESSRPEVNRIIRFWPGILRTTSCPSSHITRLQQPTESDQIFYLVTTPSLGRTYVVPRTSVIPFQAHSPDEEFLVELQSKDTEISPSDLNRKFDPSPRSSTFVTSLSKEAEPKTSPLGLLITDIRIVKQLACIWTVTDEFSAYPNPAEKLASHSPTLSPTYSGGTLARSSSFRSSLGEQNERRYMGLWWGAERIWAGDFLILSFSESMIGYTTASSPCFIQSGDRVNALPPEQRKPENEHVFLKLNCLIKAGTDVYVIGDLYKLVPSLDSAQTYQQDENPGLLPPPKGFAFRSMLSTNIGARLPIKLVRGRYYSRLHLSVGDGQPVPDERMLRAMEGCSQTDPGIRRPTKYRWESRGSLLASICPIGF